MNEPFSFFLPFASSDFAKSRQNTRTLPFNNHTPRAQIVTEEHLTLIHGILYCLLNMTNFL